MRGLVLVVVALSSAACLQKTEFHCTTSADCSASGAVCESDGYCSFTDSSCTSGRRYGDLSGAQAGKCVGTTEPIDGGVDAPIDSGPGRCPATYVAIAGSAHRYRAIATMGAWAVQKAACAADGTGIYLAVPSDQTELTALVTASTAAHVWVGIDDQTTEGTYVTTSGGTFPANDPMWDQGNSEPDNSPITGGGQADCVATVMSNSKLADDNCTHQYPAICECEP